jgi:hypothetical protein
MLRTLGLMSLLPILLVATPAAAATAEQKKETCTFGADEAKLEGKKRDDYIKKCMANANYEPAARRDAMKKTAKPAAKKPAAAPAATTAPAAPKQ